MKKEFKNVKILIVLIAQLVKEMFIISQVDLRTINILKNVSKVVAIVIGMLILLLLIVAMMYKPAYKVTMGEKVVGYIDNKDDFINKFDSFINQDSVDIAYVDMQEKPVYNFLLIDREKVINNERVYEKVISYADVYSRVHTVFANDTEIAVLPMQENVEETLQKIVDTIGNSNIDFKIQESHLINPELTTIEELVVLVEEEYKEVVKKPVLATVKKTNSGTYIDTGIEFETPLRGTITSRYGYRGGGEFHTGLDIAKPIGTPIYAAATGEVIYSDVKGTYGRVVIIQHADNVITYYAHCKDLLVKEGDFIVAGTQIATIGMTGRTTGPHLHFEVRINGETVNPEKYINNVTE